MLEKKTKALVPVILNQRVCTWIYDIGDPEITIQSAMRHYDLIGFAPQILNVHFVRRNRTISGVKNRMLEDTRSSWEIVEETYYTCEHPNIRFENETLPVIK